jgi:hypothetical protein
MTYVRIACAAAVLAVLAGCNIDRTRPAHGTVSSVIVLAVDSLWTAVGDSIETALEPRIFTVRDEKTFELTQVSPLSEDWLTLRHFKQVLAIGQPGDGWITPIMNRHGPTVQPPAIVEQRDVWARGQLVTTLLLPPGAGAADVLRLLPEAGELLDARFREYAQSRMFLSGRDSALGDTLRTERGYSLLVPEIYRRTALQDADVFRNHADLGGVLMRAIYVTWRPGVLETPTAALALAWRDSASALAFDPPQRVQTDRIEGRAVTVNGRPALEVQGVWSSAETSWPAAGPFVDRIVPCPEQNRTYYLDAWMFAPGKAKYEYMIQLETILDSFRCEGNPPAGRVAAARS